MSYKSFIDSNRGGSGSMPGQVMLDLCWTKQHWSRFSPKSKNSTCPPLVSQVFKIWYYEESVYIEQVTHRDNLTLLLPFHRPTEQYSSKNVRMYVITDLQFISRAFCDRFYSVFNYSLSVDIPNSSHITTLVYFKCSLHFRL